MNRCHWIYECQTFKPDRENKTVMQRIVSEVFYRDILNSYEYERWFIPFCAFICILIEYCLTAVTEVKSSLRLSSLLPPRHYRSQSALSFMLSHTRYHRRQSLYPPASRMHSWQGRTRKEVFATPCCAVRYTTRLTRSRRLNLPVGILWRTRSRWYPEAVGGSLSRCQLKKETGWAWITACDSHCMVIVCVVCHCWCWSTRRHVGSYWCQSEYFD